MGGSPAEVLLNSTLVKRIAALPEEKGFKAQALGISRGGRTTNVHALSDGYGRPLAFLLTGSQAADCQTTEILRHGQTPTPCIVK